MTKEITSALAMSHPTVVETINVLAEINQRLQDEIDALKEALAQEPVAKYIGEGNEGSLVQLYDNVKKGTDFYTAPPKRERAVFPTMLRKMWSGGEVQAWLDDNVNKVKNNG